jgi:hypothetical protein
LVSLSSSKTHLGVSRSARMLSRSSTVNNRQSPTHAATVHGGNPPKNSSKSFGRLTKPTGARAADSPKYGPWPGHSSQSGSETLTSYRITSAPRTDGCRLLYSWSVRGRSASCMLSPTGAKRRRSTSSRQGRAGK